MFSHFCDLLRGGAGPTEVCQTGGAHNFRDGFCGTEVGLKSGAASLETDYKRPRMDTLSPSKAIRNAQDRETANSPGK